MTLGFSQSTYPKMTKDSLVVITPMQLKKTNLIFLEHKKFKLELVEVRKQLVSYDSIVANMKKVDATQKQQIDSLTKHFKESQIAIAKYNSALEINNKKLKKQRKLSIYGFSISAALLTILLLK